MKQSGTVPVVANQLACMWTMPMNVNKNGRMLPCSEMRPARASRRLACSRASPWREPWLAGRKWQSPHRQPHWPMAWC